MEEISNIKQQGNDKNAKFVQYIHMKVGWKLKDES